MIHRCWLLAIGCWLCPGIAAAIPDSVAIDSGSARPIRPEAAPAKKWQAGAWAGASFHSKFATREGPRYRDLYMAGVRFVRVDNRLLDFALDYYIDVIPLIRSTNTPTEYRAESCSEAWGGSCPRYAMVTETVSGLGLTPIGLQLRAFARGPVQLSVGLGLGAVWYRRPVPDPGAKRLNFMGDLSAGLQFRLGNSAVLAGFRQNHTSNAGTGPVNPGIDSRVGYVGLIRSFDARPQR